MMGNGEINEGNDSSKQRKQLVEKLKIILLMLCYKDYEAKPKFINKTYCSSKDHYI